MPLLKEYILFLLKLITYVTALLSTVAGIVMITTHTTRRPKNKLTLKKLNDHYQSLTNTLNQVLLTKKEYKRYYKKQKAYTKKHQSQQKNIFVLDFQGDIQASGVDHLRESITAILQTATNEDEVVVRLESPGGLVPHYGLAASQLLRLKQKQIPLTVSIDKVAASGGYLMACVADQIIAAPFAMVGSIGVVTQLPNFNRFLKKYDIDFELLTAGNHKRTLTLFGENTEKNREKTQAQLEEVHSIFKDFIRTHRGQVDLEQVATGEHWLASQALDLKLVDRLLTSDDYLLQAHSDKTIYHLKYHTAKPSLLERIKLF